jgi:hypothetical protein
MFSSLRMRLVVGVVAPAIIVGTFLLAASGMFGSAAKVRVPALDRLTGSRAPADLSLASTSTELWLPAFGEPGSIVVDGTDFLEDPRAKGRVAKPNDLANRRHVSRNGRWYFIVAYAPGRHHHEYGTPSFLHVRRADGAAPMEGWSRYSGSKSEDRLMEDLVEPGDVIVARGWLATTSGDLHVADNGRVVVVAAEGCDEVVVRREDFSAAWEAGGAELFPGAWEAEYGRLTLDDLLSFAGGTFWYRGSWLDEDRGVVVVAGWDERIAVRRLADGAAADGVDAGELIVRGLDLAAGENAAAAWRLACMRAGPAALPAARRVMSDPTATPAVQVLAALLLGRLGEPAPPATVMSQVECVTDHDLTEFVWEHLDFGLGEKAVSAWVERLLIAGKADACSLHGSATAILQRGQPAVLALVRGMAEAKECPRHLETIESVLAHWRDGSATDTLAWSSASVAWSEFDPTTAWAEFSVNSEREKLQRLLASHALRSEDGRRARTPLLLPALSRVRREARPELGPSLRTFRDDYAARPDGTPEWQVLVLREADAALAAIDEGR